MSGRVDQWNNDDGHSFLTGGTQTTYQDRSKTAFSPRLGARYQIVSSFSLHGAVYKAFRAPNLAELYRKQVSATSITVPNPDLSAETALGREVGFDWQPVDWIQAKGTYYVAEYNDFNVPVTLTANKPAECGTIATCRIRQNVNAERSQGGEAYIALRPIHEAVHQRWRQLRRRPPAERTSRRPRPTRRSPTSTVCRRRDRPSARRTARAKRATGR